MFRVIIVVFHTTPLLMRTRITDIRWFVQFFAMITFKVVAIQAAVKDRAVVTTPGTGVVTTEMLSVATGIIQAVPDVGSIRAFDIQRTFNLF